MIVSVSEISEILGIDESEIESIVPYAESLAKSRLGYWEEEAKVVQIYFVNEPDMINLKSPLTSVEYIKVITPGEEITLGTTDYYVILAKGLIIFYTNIGDSKVVEIKFKRGWSSSTLPDLAKLLVACLTVQLLREIKPSALDIPVVEKKIGDYAISYSRAIFTKIKLNLDTIIDKIVELLRSGSDSVTVL
ncbi:MAG: hypothetical protein ACTSYR_02195 [Candidatus Odinarchaeia archaeon]